MILDLRGSLVVIVRPSQEILERRRRLFWQRKHLMEAVGCVLVKRLVGHQIELIQAIECAPERVLAHSQGEPDPISAVVADALAISRQAQEGVDSERLWG
jgi:hypothetical protein